MKRWRVSEQAGAFKAGMWAGKVLRLATIVAGLIAIGVWLGRMAMAETICGEAKAKVEDGVPWCLGPDGYERVVW